MWELFIDLGQQPKELKGSTPSQPLVKAKKKAWEKCFESIGEANERSKAAETVPQSHTNLFLAWFWYWWYTDDKYLL